MKLIMLGAPGAGKGTQAAILSERLGIPTISTGNILRAAVKNGTPVGLQAKSYMDAGKLVPDEVIIGIVDGVPRTIAQAEALDKAGVVFDCVVSIEVSDEEIQRRMTGRRCCTACGATYHVEAAPPKKEDVCDACGGELVIRDDDKLETVKNRLAVYHTETEPLKDFYARKGLLKPVENRPTIEETTAAILQTLGL